MPKPAFKLTSKFTGTEYVIYVSAPRGKARDRAWPAVFFLDGDDQFTSALMAYRSLRGARRVPPLLLIGIGYGASYTKPGNRRGRDYTPTAHRDEPSSGGGDVFLKFLTDELWPAIAQRHRVRDDIRGVAGHSLGSLLVLHALFRAPPFFTHHLASAPSIWWDERSLLRIVVAQRRRAATLKADLFLSVGAADTASMTGDLALFEAQLAARPFRGLRVTSERFPGRDHYNVIVPAFRSGLATLFGHERSGGKF